MASVSEKLSEKVKQRDWLRLLLREFLGARLSVVWAIVDIDLIHRTVDLKYVLSTQVVQVQYEGGMRLFAVATASTRKQNTRDPVSDISESLGALTTNAIARLYIVDWDTDVAIEDNLQAPASRSLTVNDVLSPYLLPYLTTWISSTSGL
jgi:AAA family ATPase